MKDVLVTVDGQVGQTARLAVALDLARSLGGSLQCVDLGSMNGDDQETDRVRRAVPRDAARAAYDVRCQIERAGLPFHWIEGLADGPAKLAQAAGSADVIVLGAPVGTRYRADKTISAALTRWAKPVIVVPPSATGLRTAGSALVLWDGSSEAEAAFQAARPLLSHANAVTLLEIDDTSLRKRARDAAAELASLNIPTRVITDLPFGKNASDVIIGQVRILHPDYIIMGGYGHIRLIEALFGGVTRRLLAESCVPLFLCH